MKSMVGIVAQEDLEGSPAHNSKVRVEKIKNMVAEGFNLCGEDQNIVKRGDSVFIKPNLFSPQNPDEATITDPGLIKSYD